MSGEAGSVDLSVVVVTWNTRDLLDACLDAVGRELYGSPPDAEGRDLHGSRPDAEGRDLHGSRGGEAAAETPGSERGLRVETLVVDNGSRDGSAELVRARFPWARLIRLPRNRGYARGANAALREARGRFALLLNTDALVSRDAVLRCVEVLEEDARVGAVGPQLVHADGRLQNSVHRFPSLPGELVPTWLPELLLPRRFPSKRRSHREPFEVEALLGASLFVRREVVERLGGLPEEYFFFLEETAWCWRMRRAGWRVLCVPQARVVHVSGASSKRRYPALTRIEYHRSLYRFLRDHRGRGTLAAVILLRVLRMALALPLTAPLALFSERQRERWRSRRQLLAWHLRGLPPRPSLADVAAPPAVDAAGRTGEACGHALGGQRGSG